MGAEMHEKSVSVAGMVGSKENNVHEWMNAWPLLMCKRGLNGVSPRDYKPCTSPIREHGWGLFQPPQQCHHALPTPWLALLLVVAQSLLEHEQKPKQKQQSQLISRLCQRVCYQRLLQRRPTAAVWRPSWRRVHCEWLRCWAPVRGGGVVVVEVRQYHVQTTERVFVVRECVCM